jgi:hypothetical protein
VTKHVIYGSPYCIPGNVVRKHFSTNFNGNETAEISFLRPVTCMIFEDQKRSEGIRRGLK